MLLQLLLCRSTRDHWALESEFPVTPLGTAVWPGPCVPRADGLGWVLASHFSASLRRRAMQPTASCALGPWFSECGTGPKNLCFSHVSG